MTDTLALDKVTASTFSPYVGTDFSLSLEEGGSSIASLVLAEVSESKFAGNGRTPFSLIFDGPPDPALEQRIYWFAHADLGVLGIFIVPISGNAEKRRYQAVFS